MQTEETEPHRRPRHIDALDGVRGMAILMVFFFHVYWGSMHPITPIGWRLHGVVTLGWTGVDLFFVLSGYLITTILLGARRAENYYQAFYMRRVLRIFPLYYLVVLTTLAVACFQHQTYSFSTQIFYLLNLSNLISAFNPAAIAPLGHLWSLGVEEQFYFLWPSVVRNLRDRHLAAVCLSIIGGVFLLRNIPPIVALVHRWPDLAYRLTPFRIDTLCAGALLAVIRRRRPELLERRWFLRILFLASGLTVLYTVMGRMPDNLRVLRFGYTAVLVCYTTLIALSLSAQSRTGRFFSNGFLRRMGTYSYCFYLLHSFVILYVWARPEINAAVARMLPFKASQNTICLVVGVLEFGFNVGVCELSARFFEQPIHGLRRYYKYTRTAVPRTYDLA